MEAKRMSDNRLYVCRLIERDRPLQALETRVLANGAMTIGRDQNADWRLPDPNGSLSRLHCTLAVRNGRLVVSDQSTNGTFLENGERAPRGAEVELKSRDCIHLGPFSVLIEQAAEAANSNSDETAFRGGASTPPRQPLPEDGQDIPHWAHRDTSLLEAFCDGANIDASALSAEDPVELMRRIGAVYQQTVVGLSSLMSERAKIKRAQPFDSTTIGPARNNPFKWAPARKLAQVLLVSENDGFLSDAEAIQSCFEDLRQHLTSTGDGASASMAATLKGLSPHEIEIEAKQRGAFLRNRSELCWEIFVKKYVEVARQADHLENPTSSGQPVRLDSW
jgi:predicted component of type VI protein secretion system